MEVSIRAAYESGIPAAYLLFEENLANVQAALPADLREAVGRTVKFDAENAADGKMQYFIYGQDNLLFIGGGKLAELKVEKFRVAVHKAIQQANKYKAKTLQVIAVGLKNAADSNYLGRALGEIPALSSYQFLKYKTSDKERNSLESVRIVTDLPNAEAQSVVGAKLAEATLITRDLVNEPPNVINAVTMAEAAVELGKKYGFSVEVFEKSKIESLKMGGLLAVNRGSFTPPTFSILEYKPANAQNSQPIILVGKGVTYDTGGLSLKPTQGSMDSMKCDMAGAGVVIGAFVALSSTQAPFHVIGLIPATDNRPGYDAYTPNDVITMYNGTTIEVLNTDAEGRMILADALSFAKQYNPQLVIDLATLTGAAVVAAGSVGACMMSTADETVNNQLKAAGFRVYERLVELPLWDEYGEMIKTPIADMKNVGPRDAGAITAGKFLQHFTDYPWIHLDIAGPAFLDAASEYRPKHGTGFGVRLLYDFITNR